MTLIMGDAVDAHNIPVKNVNAVAGYDTGEGIAWSAAEWALFPTFPKIHIDQGGDGAPVYTARVIDVETGAYTVDHIFNWMNNTSDERPTVYVNRGNEQVACQAALLSPKFKGDVWLAYPNWQPGQSLPVLPAGCHYVAIQNTYAGGYDTSVILDESWLPSAPEIAPPSTPTEGIVQQLPELSEGMGILPQAPNKYVKNAQSLLIVHGISCGPSGTDGRFGPETAAAVHVFQTNRGLLSDGIIGTAQTWPALLDVS